MNPCSRANLSRYATLGMAAVALCLCMQTGCASNGESVQATGERLFEDGRRTDAATVRSLLVKDENGLEVRQVVIADEPQRIVEVLQERINEYGEIAAVDSTTAQRLRRNGFRLIKLPENVIDELIADLGGASLDMHSWHGQIFSWRDLHTMSVGSRGRALVVDGRGRTFQGGTLQLMARGWVVKMEHGPRVQLELVPQHSRSESRYHQLLGQSYADAEPLPSLALHLLLEHGYAYILTCEDPQVRWDAAPDDEPSQASGRGPMGGLGPDVQMPTTIGQLMLSSTAGRPSRGMLVFTPRIASSLFSAGEPLVHEEYREPSP
jgi:hypothetical protein